MGKGAAIAAAPARKLFYFVIIDRYDYNSISIVLVVGILHELSLHT